MSKKISENMNRLLPLVIVAAVVMIRNITVIMHKGKPGISVLSFCIVMSVMYALLFFSKIPANKKEIFSGDSLIRFPSAIVIFFFFFSEAALTHDYCLTMAALPIMILCASDVKFMPINVVATLALTMFHYETAVFNTVPWAVATAFILVAPKLKGADLWKKLVFAATQLSTSALLIYNIYCLRFNFSLQTAKSYLFTTIVMAVFAVFFAVCIAFSLKSKKASPARKKKKSVEGKKPEYIAAIGYLIAAVFALLSTMHEMRVVMAGIAGILMMLLILCKETTCARMLTDKAAGAIGEIFDKVSVSEDDE